MNYSCKDLRIWHSWLAGHLCCWYTHQSYMYHADTLPIHEITEGSLTMEAADRLFRTLRWKRLGSDARLPSNVPKCQLTSMHSIHSLISHALCSQTHKSCTLLTHSLFMYSAHRLIIHRLSWQTHQACTKLTDSPIMHSIDRLKSCTVPTDAPVIPSADRLTSHPLYW